MSRTRTKNLIGDTFGRLTVIERAKIQNKHSVYWRCVCVCGNEKQVSTSNLLLGNVKSCGCLRKEQAIKRFRQAAIDNIKHGEARTNLYSVWHSMKSRCENTNNPVYKYYGGKGVKVCDEWKDYIGFSKWAYANGYEDSKCTKRGMRLSIDRINSNGDYCPNNCRWITVSENCKRAAEERWNNADRSKRSTRTSGAV